MPGEETAPCVCACVPVFWHLWPERVSVGQKVLEGPPGVLGSPVTPLWTALLYVYCSRQVGRALGHPRVVKLEVDVRGPLW